MSLPVRTEKEASSGSDIPVEWFAPLKQKQDERESVARPSLSYWQNAWRILRKNKLAMAGLGVLIFLFFMAALGPVLSPHSVTQQTLSEQNLPPSTEHWFGTDELGRDVFTRTWYGARISLFVGVMAALIDFAIGVIYGGIAGYKGGKTDHAMMRVIEVLHGLPYLLVVILLMVMMGPGLGTILVALTVTGWVGMARIVRGQVLKVKHDEHVLASKTFGAKTVRIIRRNLLPEHDGSDHRPDDLDGAVGHFCRGISQFPRFGHSSPVCELGCHGERRPSGDLVGTLVAAVFSRFLYFINYVRL